SCFPKAGILGGFPWLTVCSISSWLSDFPTSCGPSHGAEDLLCFVLREDALRAGRVLLARMHRKQDTPLLQSLLIEAGLLLGHLGSAGCSYASTEQDAFGSPEDRDERSHGPHPSQSWDQKARKCCEQSWGGTGCRSREGTLSHRGGARLSRLPFLGPVSHHDRDVLVGKPGFL